MILNISNRTDIIAYYSKWLINRYNEGYVDVRNPYYQNNITRIYFKDVDALIFTTKNPIPIIPYLNLLKKTIIFYITITPYHKEIEPNVINKKEIINAIKKITNVIDKEYIYIRYDGRTARPYEFERILNIERSAAPVPDVKSITKRGFKLNLSCIPNKTGSLIPKSWESIAPILVCLILLLFDFKAKAKQVPTFAKPYIAQSVIRALNPVFANKDVSIITYVWWSPVITAKGYVKPIIKPPIPKGRFISFSIIFTILSSITCIIGPTPRRITSIVISITKNGVNIRSRTLGIIFLSFFSRVAPIKPVTIAVSTLPWQPTNWELFHYIFLQNILLFHYYQS